MILVTFNAVDAFLLDDPPNWEIRPSIEATLPNSYERGITGRETRRGTGDTLRIALKYTAKLSTFDAIAALRNSLQDLNVQPVLCPFWPAPFNPGDTPLVTADFYALFAGRTFSAIVAAADLNSQPSTLIAYPLMVGILTTIPDPPLTTAKVSDVEFEFSENTDAHLSFAAFAPPDGITAAGGVRPLWPFRPNWTTKPVSGGAEVDIDRRQIGMTRGLSQAYYAQRNRRNVKQYFTLTGDSPLQLLRFFQDMLGEQNSFWLPTSIKDAVLAANVVDSDEALTVDDATRLGTNAFIILDDGFNRVPLAISSVVGNIINFAAPIGTAFNRGLTRVESLVLARFNTLKLTIDFIHSRAATATLQFKELPWETAAVAGETYGTTMGALPTTAILFKFTQTTPSGVTTWYFTGFERDLTDADGNTWLHAPMEFDTIIKTPDLKRNQTTLKSRNFTGNPLSMLFPLAAEWPLMVEIFEADVVPPYNPLIGAGGEEILGAGGEEMAAVSSN